MSNPLINGTQVTFVWHGEQAPLLVGDFTHWLNSTGAPIQPLFQQVRPQEWQFSCELPLASHWEYAFLDPQDPTRRLPDPLNPQKVDNGLHRNEFNNYFDMPGYQPSPWFSSEAEAALAGKISIHQLETYGLLPGETREVRLYRPPTEEAVPLLLVLDGLDYQERGRIVEITDNLIRAGKIQPIALALMENARDVRTLEYGASDITAAFFQWALLPFAEMQLRLLDYRQQAGVHGILGASMGGLMALYSGLRLPHIFGKVFAEAGAYRINGYELPTGDLARYAPVVPIQIWMQCGSHDFLIAPNREMAEILRTKDYNLHYREYAGAHNYTCWRDHLAEGLQALFGIPVAA